MSGLPAVETKIRPAPPAPLISSPGPRSLRVHPLGQAPTTQEPIAAPAADRRSRIPQDPLKECEHPVLVVILVHPVAREVRLCEHSAVLRVVLVDLAGPPQD